VGDLVAGRLEHQVRELVVAALRLLERQHVDLVSRQEGQYAVEPRPDRVDVPGRDPHTATLPTAHGQPG
jgi:hypothetical protein